MQDEATSREALPEGEGGNSPGWSPQHRTEPWEHDPETPSPSRRDGRNLPQNIARIEFNVMFLQKGDELSLEIALTMMLFLTRYISQCGSHLGPSNGERTVAFLPFEALDCAGFRHPKRGRALGLLHRRGDRHKRGQRKQKMDAILRSADAERLHPVFARAAAHIRPQSRLDIRNNYLFPLFGREDTMKQRATIGV